MPDLSKSRLTTLVQQMNLCSGKMGGELEHCIGNRFERFVLRSLNIPSNSKHYTPTVWTHGMRSAVKPDGVFNTVQSGLVSMPKFFPESGFLEVKATTPCILNPSSFDYQLLGMIDVLADCQAVKAGSPGQLLLVTTGGVSIGNELLIEATLSKVAFWHAIVMELNTGSAGPGILQVGPGYLKNPPVYEQKGIRGPGWPMLPAIPPKAPRMLR